MLLRGVCTMRPQEIDWMYGGGAGALKPLAWYRFLEHLHANERSQPVLGYYRRLLSEDPAVRDAAARSWMDWGMSVGFGSRTHSLDWDGSQWSYRDFPAPPGARGPPQPAPAPAARPPAPPPQPWAPNADADAGHQGRDRSTLAEPGDRGQEDPAAASAAILRRGLAYRGDPSLSASTAQALLECHYCVHGAFLRGRDAAAQLYDELYGDIGSPGSAASGDAALRDGAVWPAHDASSLIGRAGELRHIPAIAVHGQMDLVCPPVTAYDLHRAWPELQLRLVPNAGHSMYDPAITHELVEATGALHALC
ncbi:hypothetical protein GPECTOR_2g980 [Gonium pectorale]|uniref:Uncharacterized protein n=1 Tax=Gonium pectorale TaxID=33097 RepID=A0A150H2N5_GONPE|nr:hypothetical protein GPECTOR_2g980 [Gonium pectorale]|eukprot:KXZ56098.1 hypothetical protein GPECTOR_2g980 [Gonium pectorale]